MQEPTLADYGLSAADIPDFKRRQNVAARWMRSIGALLGVLAGVAWEVHYEANLGLLIVGAVLTGLLGLAFGVALEGPVAEWSDPRIGRHDQFRRAVRAFEEWELRTRSEFWWSLSGHRFEHELAALFRNQGYRVEVTKGSGDHGVDIILRHAGRTTLVQCKQQTDPVGPAVARELYGALIHFGADDGILASVSGVTRGVHAFFADKPLRVMELDEILTLQRQIQNLQE